MLSVSEAIVLGEKTVELIPILPLCHRFRASNSSVSVKGHLVVQFQRS
jgi:hypothetical protein